MEKYKYEDLGKQNENIPGVVTLGFGETDPAPGLAVTLEDIVGFIPKTTKKTIFGRCRTLESFRLKEWIFLFISVVSIIASTGFAVYRVFTLPLASEDNVFAILVLVNLAFSVWYLIHGLFQEAPFEIFVLVITTIILLLYVIINYITSTDDDIKLIRLIISCVLGPVTAILGIILTVDYFDSGNLIYRTVGGDGELQSKCRILFLGLTLMTFDAQAMTGCIVLVLDDGFVSLTLEEILVLSIGIGIVILWMVCGYYAVRLESRNLTFLFFLLSFTQPAYVIWKFVQRPDSADSTANSMIDIAIFVLGGLFFVIYIVLIVVFVKIMKNYGQGLSQKVFDCPPSYARPRNYGTMGSEVE